MMTGRKRPDISREECTEVARFLLSRIEDIGSYAQHEFVSDVRSRFGDHFVYINENGNPAIDGRVYDVFRSMHGGRIEWDRRGFMWTVDYYGPASGNEPPKEKAARRQWLEREQEMLVQKLGTANRYRPERNDSNEVRRLRVQYNQVTLLLRRLDIEESERRGRLHRLERLKSKLQIEARLLEGTIDDAEAWESEQRALQRAVDAAADDLTKLERDPPEIAPGTRPLNTPIAQARSRLTRARNRLEDETGWMLVAQGEVDNQRAVVSGIENGIHELQAEISELVDEA